MSSILLGILCGLIFGCIAAGIMLPMTFPDKRAALLGAFFNRFAIGFVIGTSNLPVPSWVKGLLFGALLSLPDAIITKAWAPIMTVGIIGGICIGFVTGIFSK